MYLFFYKLWTDYHRLLVNLILTELLVCLYGFPVDFLASWQEGWKMGRSLCISTGFILTVLGLLRIIIQPPFSHFLF